MTKCFNDSIALLHFFVRRMLAAPVAELLQFQPVRRRFAVLGLRIVPLFAITTLQRNNFSGHCSLPVSESSATAQSPRSFPLPPCVRLRGSQTAIPSPSPPA